MQDNQSNFERTFDSNSKFSNGCFGMPGYDSPGAVGSIHEHHYAFRKSHMLIGGV